MNPYEPPKSEPPPKNNTDIFVAWVTGAVLAVIVSFVAFVAARIVGR